jgi:hypothetical protein
MIAWVCEVTNQSRVNTLKGQPHMKQNVYQRIRCLSALALAAGSFAAVASAQDFDINNLPDPDRPMFAVLKNLRPDLGLRPPKELIKTIFI